VLLDAGRISIKRFANMSFFNFFKYETIIMTNKAKWIPILSLVDEFEIGEIATAIEKNGIYCIDGFGRIVKAANKPTHDKDCRTSEYAPRRLEGIYYDQMNPEPYDPLYDQFDRSDEDPLIFLGWPENDCPLLNQSMPNIAKAPKYDLSKDWKDLAVEIAENAYQSNKANGGLSGKLTDYCKIVHEEFVTHNVKTSLGKTPTTGYIQRDALRGSLWWSGKK